MSCCLSFADAKAKVTEIVELYHPDDYKIFIARREANGTEYVKHLGLVVKPNDDVNDAMFKQFVELQATASTACIKILSSQVDVRDGRMIDLFLFEITTGGQ